MLTSDPSGCMLVSDAFPKSGSRKRSLIAGHVGPADSANTGIRPAAWAGNCAIHSAAVRRCFSGGSWIAVSGAPAAGSEKLGESGVGDFGEQSTSSLLHADGEGPESTGAQDQPMAPGVQRDRAHSRSW